MLCDEGEAYARKLLEAGVRVTAVRYHGTIHDFVMLNSFTDDPAPRASHRTSFQYAKKGIVSLVKIDDDWEMIGYHIVVGSCYFPLICALTNHVNMYDVLHDTSSSGMNPIARLR